MNPDTNLIRTFFARACSWKVAPYLVLGLILGIGLVDGAWESAAACCFLF